MSLVENFCASPWMHLRITNSGEFYPCRWSRHRGNVNISQVSPVVFFQKHMSTLRQNMLQGIADTTCDWCKEMEQHGKTSGRQKQLLKAGVQLDNFQQTMLSSKFYDAWDSSNRHHGHTDLWPTDWQIDLGNHCNSACVFCLPEFSSRLASEFKQLKLISEQPPSNWTQNARTLSEFIDILAAVPNLCYLHFLGGETLITPAFDTVLDALLARGITKVAIGLTTNLTVWPTTVIDKLLRFEQVHLGMSIESLDEINDYVRWPSKIDVVKTNLTKWLHHPGTNTWFKSLRITPTVLTADRLPALFDFAWHAGVNIESCNFLQEPSFFRIGVLPIDLRRSIARDLETWTSHKNQTHTAVVNTRNPDTIKQNLLQEAQSYIDYLKNTPDESHRLPSLVDFLTKLDSGRQQNLLRYFPHYADLFRTAGYQD